MFVEVVQTASTGVSIYDLLNRSLPTFKRIYSRLTKGEVRIAIFGPGGTGKTTLGRILAREFDRLSPPFNYEGSLFTEVYKIEGPRVGVIYVAPGQERRENTWDEVLRQMVDGKIKIVINVLAWGYHSFEELALEDFQYYYQGMSERDFLAAFLQDRRQRELDIIQRLDPQIAIARGKIRMITLVTKQDLWWDQRRQVQDHYLSGEYNRYIQDLVQRRGQNHFIHEYLSASLVANNLITKQGEILALTTAGYDQNLQSANLTKLLDTIARFAEDP